MNDNALFAILKTAIEAGLAAQSVTVGIQQGYQPVNQGVPSDPFVALFKIIDTRYGFVARSNSWNATTKIMTHTELENIETTYQVGAFAIQDPNNTTQLTAADYVKAVARVLQSDTFINTLETNDVGILRIRAMRQTFFKDDKDRYEASPSFDFTVIHKDQFSETVGSTDTVVSNVTIINGA